MKSRKVSDIGLSNCWSQMELKCYCWSFMSLSKAEWMEEITEQQHAATVSINYAKARTHNFSTSFLSPPSISFIFQNSYTCQASSSSLNHTQQAAAVKKKLCNEFLF